MERQYKGEIGFTDSSTSAVYCFAKSKKEFRKKVREFIKEGPFSEMKIFKVEPIWTQQKK